MSVNDSIRAELQVNPYLSATEIMDKFGVKRYIAAKLIKQYCPISASEKTIRRNILRSNSPLVISDDANSILIGSLLGDGSIVRKGTNCVYTEGHSLVQKDYCEHKQRLFKDAGLDIKLSVTKGQVSVIDGRPIKNNGKVTLRSQINVAFNKYHDEWYGYNGKTVPRSLTKINPLMLAVWFMDDGSKHTNNAYYLSTQGFSLENVEYLRDVVNDSLDLNVAVHKNKDKYILYVPAKRSKLMTELITPYVCESMNYKLIGVVKQGELLES